MYTHSCHSFQKTSSHSPNPSKNPGSVPEPLQLPKHVGLRQVAEAESLRSEVHRLSARRAAPTKKEAESIESFNRAQNDHINTRILQTMTSGTLSCIGPWDQDVDPCVCGPLGPYLKQFLASTPRYRLTYPRYKPLHPEYSYVAGGA